MSIDLILRGHLIGVKKNGKPSSGCPKRWQKPLNRGGHFEEVLFTVFY